MDDVTEKMTHEQRCTALTAEIAALEEKYGIHAMVFSFCFEGKSGIKGKTMVTGCPEHCKQILARTSEEAEHYMAMTDRAVEAAKSAVVH